MKIIPFEDIAKLNITPDLLRTMGKRSFYS